MVPLASIEDLIRVNRQFAEISELLGQGVLEASEVVPALQGIIDGVAIDVITYQTASGKPIALTPGQTWVELLNIGAAVNVTP